MWTTSILPESCRLVVEETLPRGMYVDPDQLRDLSEMGILNTYVPGTYTFAIVLILRTHLGGNF